MYKAEPLPFSSFPHWGLLCPPMGSALRGLCLRCAMGAASFRTAFPITSAFTCAFSTNPSVQARRSRAVEYPRDHHPGRGEGGCLLGCTQPLGLRCQRHVLPLQGSKTAATFPACLTGELQTERSPRHPWGWDGGPGSHGIPRHRRRADAGPHSITVTPVSNDTASLGHDMLMGTELSNTTRQPKALVVTTTGPLDDSPEPHELLGTEVDNISSQALVLTTVSLLNETNSPQPIVLLGTKPPPQPGNTPRQVKASPVTTADPLDETNTPEPIAPLGTELLPKMGDSTSQAKASVVTTTDPLDETDPPETVPGTAAQSGSTIVPNELMESTGHGTDGTITSGIDASTEPRSALFPTTKFSKKSGSHPPWDANTTPLSIKPWGTTAPLPSDDLWDNSSLMNKCLLAILLLALVAGFFMVCTAVLGTLLWRRVRTARRQLGPTEMICISSLLPDSERAATNGPRRGAHVRHKLLVDAGSEADGDNLTLSSFLPEHP
ncbi:LOW QUALITY PROTEIN: P-selectin glycoprotein ligand 1 [Excalfactoria chinensis]|uniref:LOW QUALITY PROTEIN: P-selectin glycoprotein ligand 1 n=1 Tax=Excalfactoria chinensis TaxID=46218 RepID=UPI003B3BC49F